MSDAHTTQIVARLRSMQAAAPDIEASAVVSVDGFTMASAWQHGIEEDRVSAMSAILLGLDEPFSGELGRGSLEQAHTRGGLGAVVLTSVGTDAVLTALAHQETKLGLIFLKMRRAVEDISKFVG